MIKELRTILFAITIIAFVILLRVFAVKAQSIDPCAPETYTCNCPLQPKQPQCYTGLPGNWVDYDACDSPDGYCNSCAEFLAWMPDMCSRPPYSHGCCYPHNPAVPLVKSDGNGGFIVAPDECQMGGNPHVNFNAPAHCIAWLDPEPPTFSGCDYANTPFEQLSAHCQAQFMGDNQPPCVYTTWETYMNLRKLSSNPEDPNDPFANWAAACQTITQVALIGKWCADGQQWACETVKGLAGK